MTFLAEGQRRYLELANPRQAIADLEDWERASTTMDTPGGIQLVNLISESGLYTLASKSRKPNAKKFRQWVYSEVVPSIRETGSYSMQPQIEAPQVDPMDLLNDPDFVLALIARRDQEKKLLEQEVAAKVEVIEKKERMIEYKDQRYREATHQLIRAEKKSKQFERYAKAFQKVKASDGTSTITAIGKLLQIRRKLLIEYMSDKSKGPKKWLYKTGTNKHKNNNPWVIGKEVCSPLGFNKVSSTIR